MDNKYTVIDEFMVKDNKILVLDKDRNIHDFNTSKIIIDGESCPYGLTHNRKWITVRLD